MLYDLIVYRISDSVSDSVLTGELVEEIVIEDEEHSFSGWFTVKISYGEDEDEKDDDLVNEQVAKSILSGNSSGYSPTFSWSANIHRG